MAQLNFDARQVAPDQGMEVLPVAWYNVAIDESEMKPTKDNATTGGFYLSLRFNILDGQYAGRKLFSRLNLRNANPVAQEIAFKQLSAIAHAVGVLQVADSNQLHGIPLKVKLKIRKGNQDPAKGDTYEDQNEITIYKNINEPTDGAAGGQAGIPAGFGGQQAQQPVQAPGAFGGTQGAPTGFAQPAAPAAVVQPGFQQPQAQQPWGQPGAAQPQAQPQQFQQPVQQQQPVFPGQPQPGQQPQFQQPQGQPVQYQQPVAQPQPGQPVQQQPVQQQPAFDPTQQAQTAVPPWQR